MLNGVGGNVEPGEFLDPKLAMVREFAEETPWRLEYDRWAHYADMDLRGKWLVHVFFAYNKKLGEDPMLDSELRVWNQRGVDEPLYIVRTANLPLAQHCINNLPGLIGFIKDYDSARQPLEIRY